MWWCLLDVDGPSSRTWSRQSSNLVGESLENPVHRSHVSEVGCCSERACISAWRHWHGGAVFDNGFKTRAIGKMGLCEDTTDTLVSPHRVTKVSGPYYFFIVTRKHTHFKDGLVTQFTWQCTNSMVQGRHFTGPIMAKCIQQQNMWKLNQSTKIVFRVNAFQNYICNRYFSPCFNFIHK